MKLLVTGAFKCADKELNALQEMGHKVIFMQNEIDSLPCKYDEVEGVICNGLFLHHPIEKFTSLRYVQLTSAGFDRAPMDYIKKKGIKINNAKGVYSVPMAEFALCGVLDLYKRSRFFAENQKAHKWEKCRELFELSGKTVSIVGCGSVGSECAKRFKGFDASVFAVDIKKPESPYFDKFFPLEKIKEALDASDIIILTLPLTDKTKNMFSEDLFSCFKKNCVLINIARGAIVNEKALINALQNGTLYGAVLDVFENEPLSDDSPLWNMQNVILTPHNSFVGEGNKERLYKLIVNNLSQAN